MLNRPSVSILLLLVAQVSVAQSSASLLSRFSFGVTGGIQLTELSPEAIDFPTILTRATNFESRRYTVGPALEFAINDRFAIEFNPLYKRLGSTDTTAIFMSSTPLGPSFLATRARAHAWEFPALGKYYFGSSDRSWRAFAGAGPSWETRWQRRDVRFGPLDPITGTPAPLTLQSLTIYARTPVRPGIVFDGGLLLQKGRLGISPEFRYTKWGGTSTPPEARERNQAEILVTVRF